MANLQDVMKQQEERATEIDRLISNIKKAPQDRRNLEFYKSKSEELSKLWQVFDKSENIIRRDQTLPYDDAYFVKNLYQTIGEKYDAVMEHIELQIKKLTEGLKPSPAVRNSETLAIHQSTQVEGLARRVTARMVALTRLLQTLTSFKEDQPQEFYTIKADTIKNLWNQIQVLYDELWQQT